MSDTETPADDSRAATQLESTQILLPITLGCQVALVLYGIYLVLHGRYVASRMYEKALRPVKAMLWVVFVLLTGYIGLAVAEIVTWTITTDRSLGRLYSGYTFESFPGFIGGLIGNIVQSFLMLRASALFRSRKLRWIFLGFTSLLILFSAITNVFQLVNNWLFFTNHPYITDFNNITTTWFFSLAAIDILISVSLAATLKQRIGGFNANTDALLRQLAVTALQTAAYTSVFALCGDPIPCCYGLSLYTTLSARQTVERYLGAGNAPLPLSLPSSAATGGKAPTASSAVHILQTVGAEPEEAER
ncbi:hypothetical protein JCM10207_003872 [Rhodosporidiobolus poonsookiae]